MVGGVEDRPDYVPPFYIGSEGGRWAGSPPGVIRQLVVTPITGAVFGIVLLAHGHVLGGAVALTISAVAVSLAIMYVPRAVKAARPTAPTAWSTVPGAQATASAAKRSASAAEPMASKLFTSRSGLVLTTSAVMWGGLPILSVERDGNDGAWQFVNGRGDTERGMALFPLHPRHIVELDGTVTALSDLPSGWRATRPTTADDWVREVQPAQ
jgi:hypothetical protein